MSKIILSSKRSKVLPFEQNGQFYYKKALKYIDNNNYVNALNFYRKAVEKDPDNINYKVELSQIFSEMNFYDESNAMLFSMLQKDSKRTECYFGLGCNFMALREYDNALNCFDKYLSLDVDGIYAEDAGDLLELLKSAEYYPGEDMFLKVEPGKSKLFELANKGKDFLDAGDYKRAIRYMERVVKADPTIVFARNNLSLAYYCIGNYNKAIKLTNKILDEYPQNLHASCNLAIMLNDKGNDSQLSELKDAILRYKTGDPDEIYKIAVTLCELKMHSDANKTLKQLLQYKPYDLKILHYYAVSFFNLKDFKEALRIWDKIEKIAPYNMISNHFKKITRVHMKDSREFMELGYHFQVPYEEIILRVKKINDLLNLPTEELLFKWERNEHVKALLAWGLSLNDTTTRKAILYSVASLKGKRAEYFLRELCLRRQLDDDIKRYILLLLCQMDAQPPYVGYINNSLIEIQQNYLTFNISELPPVYQEVLERATNNLSKRFSSGYEPEVKELWAKFLSAFEKDSLPVIRNLIAWAAALELYFCLQKGNEVAKIEIARSSGVPNSTLSAHYDELASKLDAM